MNIKQQNSISLFTVAAIVPNVLRSLDPVSLLHLSATSQDFYRLVNDDLVWKRHVSRHVGVSMCRMPPKIAGALLPPSIAGVTASPWKRVALGMEALDCEEAVASLTLCNKNATEAYNAAVSYLATHHASKQHEIQARHLHYAAYYGLLKRCSWSLGVASLGTGALVGLAVACLWQNIRHARMTSKEFVDSCLNHNRVSRWVTTQVLRVVPAPLYHFFCVAWSLNEFKNITGQAVNQLVLTGGVVEDMARLHRAHQRGLQYIALEAKVHALRDAYAP